MKNLKLLIVAALVAVVVIAVTNSDKLEENLSWMFEADDSHIALPELSNKEIERVANENKSLETQKTPAKKSIIVKAKEAAEEIDEEITDNNEELEEITN